MQKFSAHRDGSITDNGNYYFGLVHRALTQCTVAAATDDADGSVCVKCKPPSGSTFPLDETRVESSITDAAGYPFSGTFNVPELWKLKACTISDKNAAYNKGKAGNTVPLNSMSMVLKR